MNAGIEMYCSRVPCIYYQKMNEPILIIAYGWAEAVPEETMWSLGIGQGRWCKKLLTQTPPPRKKFYRRADRHRGLQKQRWTRFTWWCHLCCHWWLCWSDCCQNTTLRARLKAFSMPRGRMSPYLTTMSFYGDDLSKSPYSLILAFVHYFPYLSRCPEDPLFV